MRDAPQGRDIAICEVSNSKTLALLTKCLIRDGRSLALDRSMPLVVASENSGVAVCISRPEVLAQMAEGRSNTAIAETLVVSERAVERHVSNIFSKPAIV